MIGCARPGCDSLATGMQAASRRAGQALPKPIQTGLQMAALLGRSRPCCAAPENAPAASERRARANAGAVVEVAGPQAGEA